MQGLSLFSCVAISMVVQDFVDHGSWGKIHTRVYGTTLSQLGFVQAQRHPWGSFSSTDPPQKTLCDSFLWFVPSRNVSVLLAWWVPDTRIRTRSRLPKFCTYDNLAQKNLSLPHALKNQIWRPARYCGAFHLIADALIRTHNSSYLGYENRFEHNCGKFVPSKRTAEYVKKTFRRKTYMKEAL